MVTKAVVRSIKGNRCIVEMPLFQTAASSAPVLAEALVSITPGLFNNLFVDDIVFVAFEENALEKPIILGKLFLGNENESNTNGGAAVFDTLKVRNEATLPCSTLFVFPDETKAEYEDLKTPKKIADYIKWLEKLSKKLIDQLENHFKCLKNWTQFQLEPQNVEVDDGDIDAKQEIPEEFLYQKEGQECKICGNNCTKDQNRCYLKLPTTKKYPDI